MDFCIRYLFLLFFVLATHLPALTLEDKVGQLFFGIVYGAPLSPASHEMLKETHLGNVILFNWCNSLESQEEAATLTNEIRETITTITGIRPWIAVDQEGGRICRLLPPGFKANPSPGSLAREGYSKKAFLLGLSIAEELSSIGIDINLAPVVDVVDAKNPVSFINERSFGNNPAQVTAFAGEFIDGLHEKGIFATLKHFPGHGSTKVDSHLALPLIDRDASEIENVDLAPFAALKDKTDFIMTGHLFVPVYDALFPATTSRRILTGLLRNQIGYKGLIITDSLVMRGIAPHQETFEQTVNSVAMAAIQAFLAGADLLLISRPEQADFKNSPDEDMRFMKEVIMAFRRAVVEGVVPMERVDETLEKILTKKRHLES